MTRPGDVQRLPEEFTHLHGSCTSELPDPSAPTCPCRGSGVTAACKISTIHIFMGIRCAFTRNPQDARTSPFCPSDRERVQGTKELFCVALFKQRPSWCQDALDAHPQGQAEEAGRAGMKMCLLSSYRPPSSGAWHR